VIFVQLVLQLVDYGSWILVLDNLYNGYFIKAIWFYLGMQLFVNDYHYPKSRPLLINEEIVIDL